MHYLDCAPYHLHSHQHPNNCNGAKSHQDCNAHWTIPQSIEKKDGQVAAPRESWLTKTQVEINEIKSRKLLKIRHVEVDKRRKKEEI